MMLKYIIKDLKETLAYLPTGSWRVLLWDCS